MSPSTQMSRHMRHKLRIKVLTSCDRFSCAETACCLNVMKSWLCTLLQQDKCIPTHTHTRFSSEPFPSFTIKVIDDVTHTQEQSRSHPWPEGGCDLWCNQWNPLIVSCELGLKWHFPHLLHVLHVCWEQRFEVWLSMWHWNKELALQRAAPALAELWRGLFIEQILHGELNPQQCDQFSCNANLSNI